MTHRDISERKAVACTTALWLACAGVQTVPAYATKSEEDEALKQCTLNHIVGKDTGVKLDLAQAMQKCRETLALIKRWELQTTVSKGAGADNRTGQQEQTWTSEDEKNAQYYNRMVGAHGAK